MSDNLLGMVAKSKAGRDKDKYFIVLSIISSEYVYISDGSLRLAEKPKKKKIKHLSMIGPADNKILEALKNGEKVSNTTIRKFLQSMDAYKEV